MSSSPTGVPYWESKSLEQMSTEEWEALCDGCAKCCVHKLQDEDTDRVYFTTVACGLLDTDTCRCSGYEIRQKLVPECMVLTPAGAHNIEWLPHSCAYRRIAEGRGLAPWHPLISGTNTSVHDAGVSVRGLVISERFVDLAHIEEYVIDEFPDEDQSAHS